MRWGFRTPDIRIATAAIVGCWLLVLAGWCALEAVGLASPRVWLPPVVAASPSVLALLIAVSIVGIAVFVWDAHTRWFSSPRGFGLAALLVVGATFIALGATALGLGLAVPAALLGAVTALSHLRSRRHNEPIDIIEMALRAGVESRMVLDPIQMCAKRVRWYYAWDDEEGSMGLRCHTWCADGTETDRPASSFDPFPNQYIDFLIKFAGCSAETLEVTRAVSVVADVDPAAIHADFINDLGLERAEREWKKFAQKVGAGELRPFPRHVRLHITFEPTLFGANIDIRYEYPQELPSYEPVPCAD